MIKFGIDRKDPITGMIIPKRGKSVTLGNPLASWTIPSSCLTKDSVCYFVGAGEDISFDIAVANTYKCKVVTLDPTPKAIGHFEKLKSSIRRSSSVNDLNNETLQFLDFVPVGVWKENTKLKFYSPENPNHVSHSVVNLQKTDTFFEAEVKTLKTLMSELKHDKIDILKIDIEGAEYEVLKSLSVEKVFPKVICIEYDEVFNSLNEGYEKRINDSLNKLFAEGYYIYHLDYPGNYTLIKE